MAHRIPDERQKRQVRFEVRPRRCRVGQGFRTGMPGFLVLRKTCGVVGDAVTRSSRMVPEVCCRRRDLYPPPVADAGSKACTRGLRARPRCRSLLEDERRDRCSTTCQPGPFGKLLRLSKCCGKSDVRRRVSQLTGRAAILLQQRWATGGGGTPVWYKIT